MNYSNQPELDLLSGDQPQIPQKEKENLFSVDYLHQLYLQTASQKMKEKIEMLINILKQDCISLQQMQENCFYGIPDECRGLRALCWKILLQYLPQKREKWAKTIQDNYEIYNQYCDELLKKKRAPNSQSKAQDIQQPNQQQQFKQQGQMEEVKQMQQQQNLKINKANDDPLSLNKDSQWNQFYQDQFLWEEIEKDTARTRSEMHFFVTETKKPVIYPIPFKTQIREERRRNNDMSEKHYDVLSRILFIYGKLNPGIKYVQGMNELLAPIYHVFCNDPSEIFQKTVESDSFFCFTMLMADVKDCFIKSLDEADTGIKSRVMFINKLLKCIDPQVWKYLEDLGINPHFYSLRWVMLLLTQEFELLDVLRLWDSLLSRQDKISYLNFLCLAIIQIKRDKIVDQDFTYVMENLQRIQDLDIINIIIKANSLYDQYQYLLNQTN